MTDEDIDLSFLDRPEILGIVFYPEEAPSNRLPLMQGIILWKSKKGSEYNADITAREQTTDAVCVVVDCRLP
jgi:hypothetical protein